MKVENKISKIYFVQRYSLNGKSMGDLGVSCLVDLELYHYRL